MDRALQIFIALPGFGMGLQAIGWLLDPKSAAESLGMPLLDGVARSTQVGDMTAFFAAVSAMILLGSFRREPPWLVSAAMLLGGAAAFRVLAWAAHDADLAVQFIAGELVMTAILLFGVMRFRKPT